MSNLVGLGDVRVQQYKNLKLQKNESVRVTIPYPEKMLIVNNHYVEGVGYLRCLKDKEGVTECPICDAVGAPPRRFRLLVIKYQTQNLDGFLEEGEEETVKVVPYLFQFGESLLTQLQTKHKKALRDSKRGIASLDLILTCTEEQYQKITIEDDGKASYLSNESLKARVKKAIEEAPDLEGSLTKYPTSVQLNNALEILLGKGNFKKQQVTREEIEEADDAAAAFQSRFKDDEPEESDPFNDEPEVKEVVPKKPAAKAKASAKPAKKVEPVEEEDETEDLPF